MKRIWITGIAGFIGSHLAERLLERGDEVSGNDNFNDYYRISTGRDDVDWKVENKEIVMAKRGKVVKVDLREKQFGDVVRDFKPDVIVHLAAMAGVRYSIEQPALYMDVNVLGTQRVLDIAKELGIPSVLASSSSVYGARTKTPFRETDDVAAQVSPYAASKRSVELLASVHHHLTQLPVTCLRFFTVYGPRGRPDMAPFKFMDWIYSGKEVSKFGDGTTARDYTYVDDIVSGVIGAIDNPCGYLIANLGNSELVNLNEMISTQEAVVGKKAVIKQLGEQPGDVPVTFSDVSVARKEFGYEPTTSLKEGLEKQWAWYKQQFID